MAKEEGKKSSPTPPVDVNIISVSNLNKEFY